MNEAIVFESLEVRFGRSRVVRALDLRVPSGCVFALLGRNGAGKTSLVRCLLGLRPPSAGRLRVLGLDPWRERRRLLARVGVVPEAPDAPPELTPGQLSVLCGRLHGRWQAAEVQDRLLRLGVPLGRSFRELSRGQKGAVMLALALGHQPELLVLDDPTLGLDVVARDSLLGEVIRDLADRGLGVFMTSHDLGLVERLADRVGVLHDGELLANEDITTLKERFRPDPSAPVSLEDVFKALVGEGRAA